MLTVPIGIMTEWISPCRVAINVKLMESFCYENSIDFFFRSWLGAKIAKGNLKNNWFEIFVVRVLWCTSDGVESPQIIDWQMD